MIRTLSLIPMVVLLLATTRAAAENPQTSGKQLDDILASIRSLKTDLDFFKTADIDKRLREIEARLRRMDDPAAGQPVPGRQISNFAPLDSERQAADLLLEMRSLEERVRRLEDQMRTPPPGNDSVRIQRSIAIPSAIRLRNTSGLPATIYVNGVGYDLNPFEVRTLTNQRSGIFNYEVQVAGYGLVRPLTARTLGEGETYAITIYPPG